MRNPENVEFFNIFGDEHDRFAFPEGIIRVTGGHGGEAILFCGSEKTALLDCGNSYCGQITAENLKEALNGRTLDYVMLSHSHYDHIGALPYIKQAFPEATVLGAENAARILPRPGARKVMKELGEASRDMYEPGCTVEIITDGLEVDKVIGEGDVIDLGGRTVSVMETKGHTDCSLSFVLQPDSILFASESTGILENIDYIHTPILKGFDNAMTAFEKCRNCDVKHISLPHFGLIPEHFNETYWELYQKEIDKKFDFLRDLKQQGKSDEEIYELYAEKYWQPLKAQEQPYEAFAINSKYIVRVFLDKMEEENE
jgi:glyoxylase-like metal-dependent hydrolase (beta-lactamase superfamily II)